MKKIFIISVLIMLSSCMIAQTATNGLIANYPFNSNTNDESGNNFNGVNHGCILTTDRFGTPYSAYYFDGIKSYIDLGISENFMPSNISFCCWFNTDNKTNKIMQLLRLRNYGYSLSLFSKDNPAPNGLLISYYTEYGKNSVLYDQSNQDFSDGLWHFAVFTYDSICGKFYVDNKLISSETANKKSSLFYTYGGIAIGRDGDYNGFYFNGKIDDIKIYNRPLSQYEIANLYHDGITDFNPLTYKNTIKIYPNPTNNSIIIDCGNNFETLKDYNIKITNNLGQIVYVSTINDKQKMINLSTWTGKGIYLINIIDKSERIVESKKIVLN